MFLVHTTPETFENVIVTGHFVFVFEDNPVRPGNDMILVTLFEKLRFQNVFRLH